LAGPEGLGNPSSATHLYGRAAAARIERARAEVATLVGAAPADVIFTSGATESDNLALLGVARGRASFGRHLVLPRTEHKAVLDPARHLEKTGWTVTWLEPAADGRITPEAVAAALRPDTQLVSVMHANNETGVVNDIAAIAALCRARDVLVHTDAAQSAGKLPIDLAALGVDLLSLSAHKMYGPKGVGALVVTPRARPWVEPLLWGGPQERGLRAGTPATHQIAGFGVAAALAAAQLAADAAHTGALVARLSAALADLPGLRFNDHPSARLPGLVSLSIAGVEGESLIDALPQLAVSSGAACDSTSGEPSYVLRAFGLPPELAQSTLRIAFGRFNTAAEADLAAAAIRDAVMRLRAEDAPGPPAAALEGDAWVVGEAGRTREGARVRCYLQVAGSVITAAEFRVFGCPHTRAVAKALAAALPGRPLDPAVPDAAVPDAAAATPTLGSPRDWAARHGVQPEKLGRLLVVEDAWLRAREAALARSAVDSR
ncbi:MAG: cysteine desulfurase family protein, partial [Gammaproteobacteria bacterium]